MTRTMIPVSYEVRRMLKLVKDSEGRSYDGMLRVLLESYMKK